MVRAGLTQPEGARSLFAAFSFEFPEVKEKSTFFFTRRDSYAAGEELSVLYGNSYNRTYSTWGIHICICMYMYVCICIHINSYI